MGSSLRLDLSGLHPHLAKLCRRWRGWWEDASEAFQSRHLWDPYSEERLGAGWLFGMRYRLVGMIPASSPVLQLCPPLCN